jgi:hypothetical protein
MALPDYLDFELPDAPDFVSLPPKASLDQMVDFIEDLRKWFPTPAAAIELKRQGMVDVEFVL